MPIRETIQRKSKPILTLGSVNERVQGTELPDNEWSSIVGTFPEFTGLQAKVWGKRLLEKYPFPIMGIYQFWTPLGYAGGLFQFTGTVDFGKWITQTTKLNLAIPDTINFDGGNMSLDDFGFEFGRTFTLIAPNVCTFNFAEFTATHVYCGTKIKRENTPDDTNGGPDGQGKKCKWKVISTPYAISDYDTLQETSTGGVATIENANFSGGVFVPNPVTAPPIATFTTYAPAVPDPVPQCAISRIGSGLLLTPTTGLIFKNNISTNRRVYLNLTPLLVDVAGYESSSFITVRVTRTNFDGITFQDVPIAVNWNSPSNIMIDLKDLLPEGIVQQTGFGNPFGQTIIYSSQITGFDLHIRKKVCQ